jgi:hypothetical protein
MLQGLTNTPNPTSHCMHGSVPCRVLISGKLLVLSRRQRHSYLFTDRRHTYLKSKCDRVYGCVFVYSRYHGTHCNSVLRLWRYCLYRIQRQSSMVLQLEKLRRSISALPWLISNLMYKILIYLHIIHLLKSPTYFEHYPAHLQDVYIVIVYMQPLVSSLSAGDCLVHRLRKNSFLTGAQDSHLQTVTIPEAATLSQPVHKTVTCRE